MRVVGRKLSSLVVVLAMSGAVASVVTAAPAGAVGPTTVIVGNGDLAPNGPWALEPTSNTGSIAFVNGPAPTPGGTGSLAMTIASGQHEWLNNYAYGVCATGPCNTPATMTPITNFDALSYSVYRAAGSVMPTFNIEVYITGTSGYTTLAFVPDASAVVNSTWQTWDAMNPTAGVWYSSQNVGSGVFTCSPFSCSASWSQVTASYPNAKVVYGLGPNVGTGGTFNGNVDNFTVGVSGSTNVYDFEPNCTSTCFVDAATGNDNNTGLSGDPLKTIQAGVNKAQAGGTVLLSAGTFAENVTVAKSVDIQGSGASTVVVPAVSNPDCGGAGGASLCTGASNVFLVQHDGVTIDHLTVDGDNPSLTGVAVGGADVDARNGIITDHSLNVVFNSLSVHDVTVKNVFLRGIYASTGGSFNLSNNTVDNVQGDPASIGIFNWLGVGTIANNHVSNANDAISANHSRGTVFTGNTVTASNSGVHTDNNGDSGGSADTITGNNVSACTANGYGVWAFVPYLGATISNNTVSGCSVGLAAFASCDLAGTNSCPGGVIPTVTFSSNTVTGTSLGQGLYATTNSFIAGDGEVHVQADHNVVSGADDGVYVEETGTAHAAVTLSRNALAGNTSHAVNNVGTTNVDAKCNWWGQSSGPATGQVSGSVTTDPYLISSNLAGNCLPVVRIGLAKVSVVEGNSGLIPAHLTVTLDRKSSQTVTVPWHTMNGTAGSPDYVGAFGSLSFAPGQTTKTITVNVKGDTILEDYEYFTVKLVSATNGFLANSQEQVEIKNDDKPTMTVNNVSATEGSPATFTVTLAQRYYLPITVGVSSTNGTAHAPGDYTAVPAGRTITISAGTTSKAISVPVNLDGLTEPAETFKLTFTSGSVNNSPKTATATIQANAT